MHRQQRQYGKLCWRLEYHWPFSYACAPVNMYRVPSSLSRTLISFSPRMWNICSTMVQCDSLQAITYRILNFIISKWSSLACCMPKNIRQDYGVPIWFRTLDSAGQSVSFVHLVYLWSKNSKRNADNPFLSFRRMGVLNCLLYSDI